MKQVNIRELKANLSKYLKDLPLEITTHGKPIAWLVEPEGEEAKKFLVSKKEIPLDERVDLENVTLDTDFFVRSAIEQKQKLPFNGGPCFHRAKPGECLISWCPNARNPK